jgi:hypothetical protein
LVAVGLLVLLFVCLPRRGVGPLYGGRRLSEWAAIYSKDIGEDVSAADNEAAAEAIRGIGTNALPYLLQWIDYEPAAWRYKNFQKLPTSLQQTPLANWLFFPDQRGFDSESIAAAFAALGPIASPAIPELMQRTNRTNSPAKINNAIFALCSLAPIGVQEMEKILSDPQRAGQPWTMFWIRKIGTNARPFIPVLVDHLDHSNVWTAQLAAQIMGEFKSESDIVVPALASALSHGSAFYDGRRYVQVAAARALGEFGESARPAVGALCSALTNANASIRWEATNTLLKIAPETLTNALAK